jgi:hypothetical protein
MFILFIMSNITPQPFSQKVIEVAWTRSRKGHKNLKSDQGICECKDTGCSHTSDPPSVKSSLNQCERTVIWEQRGKDSFSGGWEVHHIDPQGKPTLANSQILCCECHRKTDSYGKHRKT